MLLLKKVDQHTH